MRVMRKPRDGRVEEPLSDSDDDDDDNYVGYVSTQAENAAKEGRKMSSSMGAGGMVGGATNRARPLGLLGVRKPLVINSPTVEGTYLFAVAYVTST
jgi:hypothetical protein